jgi:transcriptional regulator with XRE-family HTH domain
MSKRSKRKFITADEFRNQFSPENLALVAARTKQLVAEELTLRDLRKAMNLTQTQLSATLGVQQAHVSRIEQRTDMLLSTLASYVRAMGGSLKFVVTFPDREPVSLTSLADVFEPEAPSEKAPRRRKKSGVAATT